MNNRSAAWLAAMLLAATIGGCALVRDAKIPHEWEPLLEEIKAFERRIGFEGSDTFYEFSTEEGRYTFCGQVSRFTLPYSYEDPAILWTDDDTEKDCHAIGADVDAYFGSVEALGEVGQAVTSDMLGVPLHRFVYLVIHEDCHDEFALPYGIEEALCNLIAYKGMAAFSSGRYKTFSRENVAIRRYANLESERTRTVKTLYEQLAEHYARYQRKQIPAEALLRERARILGQAERALRWKRDSLNNVGIANEMTYSRHYPLLEQVYAALGSDLARALAFFKRVDAMKASPFEVMKRLRLTDEKSVEFIRAYEAEIVKTIERALAEETRR